MHLLSSILLATDSLTYAYSHEPLPLGRHVQRRQAESELHVPTELVSLPLDQGDLSAGQFLNRFWVNDFFYKPGGPVFLFDIGEQNAERFVERTTKNGTFQSQMLAEHHGIGITWEHRY